MCFKLDSRSENMEKRKLPLSAVGDFCIAFIECFYSVFALQVKKMLRKMRAACRSMCPRFLRVGKCIRGPAGKAGFGTGIPADAERCQAAMFSGPSLCPDRFSATLGRSRFTYLYLILHTTLSWYQLLNTCDSLTWRSEKGSWRWKLDQVSRS
jgi:hypothetical protein